MRALWRTRTLRAHTFALLRTRFDLARRKLQRIQAGLIVNNPRIAAAIISMLELCWGFATKATKY